MKIHRYITIFLFFILSDSSFAQSVPHLNLWSRISVSQTISEKWGAEAEFQHRRQNNIVARSENLLQENLLSSVRTWVHYHHREDMSFAVSPFAYYWHNPIIVSDSDKLKPQVQELRFSMAIDLKHEIIENLWLINRSAVEYRDFVNTNADFIRVRSRLGVRYEFSNQWNLTVFDELFLNLKGAQTIHIFDHDRLAFLLNYKPTKDIRVEIGYIYISRLPRNTDEFLHEHNFLLHLYFTLPHPIDDNHHTKHQKHS